MNANLNFTTTEASSTNDPQEGVYMPEVSLGIVGRIGLDGESAYELAVKYGYEGTEEEWAASLVNPADEAAKRAEKAAEKAQKAAGNINDAVTGKASLDTNKQYVLPSQINPLTGLQTGAVCAAGYYTSSAGILNNIDTKTVEILFTTPSNLSGTSYIAGNSNPNEGNIKVFIKDGELNINAVKSYIKSKNIRPESTYHIIMVFEKNAASRIYLNGTLIGKGTHINQAASLFTLGNNFEGNAPFKGTIHALRVFSKALSTEEAELLWNLGRPGNIRVLRQWYSDISKECVAEYTACGLLPDKWRDTSESGSGSSLNTKKYPEYGYLLPQDMNELVISSGRITQNIEYSKGNSANLYPPAGYVASYIIVRNYNPNDITDFQIISAEEELVILPKCSIRQGAWEDRLCWGGSYRIGEDDFLTACATGNDSGKGIEITIFYKWVGHNHYQG